MDYVKELGKNFNIKDKTTYIPLAAFAAFFIAGILMGVLVFHQPAIVMIGVALLEVLIAVLLHKAELWLHIAIILAELIVGVIASRVVVMVILVIIYAAATAALMFISGKDK